MATRGEVVVLGVDRDGRWIVEAVGPAAAEVLARAKHHGRAIRISDPKRRPPPLKLTRYPGEPGKETDDG